ncbi:hypothetical protein HQO42_23080 [Rhodococcus fascians]|nr:hypothetical protein [Rhodococcus fascians]MBY4239937.1 hypothetical protein [Rhodococcus fascians]MBY4255541.1 hypothetical protein [Rhodococcus fascians]MBY4271268.1 hypothetical protein [Rhodococcus fascians]
MAKWTRKLVDMAELPPKLVFERRTDAELVMDSPIHLSDDGDVLHQREWHFRNQVVDFALMHYLTGEHPENPASDASADVARIDTCHSEVHQHQFYRSGKPQNRQVLVPLHDCASLEDAEKAVNDCYDDCYLDMVGDWQDHLDRWKEIIP